MFRFLILNLVIISSSAYSETLQELEKLSSEPLYFTVPISEYQITPSQTCTKGQDCDVFLNISFSEFDNSATSEVNQITVITDRPIRQTNKVEMTEFVAYTTSAEKSGLVFTFDIKYGDKVVPANFTVQNVTFDEEKKQLLTKSKMNLLDQSVIDDLNNNKVLTGDGAVLNVEG